MVDRLISTEATEAKTGLKPQIVRRVYCGQNADMYTTDGTPLYLEWIIEDVDGALYRVPAEPGGWLRRTPYGECADGLKVIPAHKAETIIWLTYADTDHAEDVSARGHLGYTGYMGYMGYMGYSEYILEHRTF
jgi:hypothetical protein